MVKLRQLLGSRREVYYECMYTKHKTQKNKVWHDGFLALYDSRRIVLHEEMPPNGKTLDEAKLTPQQWDFVDEEYISVPKYFVEVINETPIEAATANGTGSRHNGVPNPPAAQPVEVKAPIRRGGLSRRPLGPRPAVSSSKFKSPVVSSTPPPPPVQYAVASPVRQPVLHAPTQLTKRTASGMPKESSAPAYTFDFDKNPTSEWDYKPNSITRTPDEVAALWFGDELFQ